MNRDRKRQSELNHVLDVLDNTTRLSLGELRDFIEKTNDDDTVVSLTEEIIRLEGIKNVIHRVFVNKKSAKTYAHVGWVMNDDITQCMTCAKPFWFFHTRKHCHACGNINCSSCAKSFCLVSELPDQLRGVPVCNLCYWGQQPVMANCNKVIDDSKISEPIEAQKSLKTSTKVSSSEPMVISSSTKIETEYQSEQPLRRQHSAPSVDPGIEKENRSSPTQHTRDVLPNSMNSVAPQPLYVMKTKRESSDVKVFINVCTTKNLDLYSIVGARRGIFLNGVNPVESLDKTGEKCFTYDVLVNTAPSMGTSYDVSCAELWMEKVGREIINVINSECNEALSLSFKFPKIKGDYKGVEVKLLDMSRNNVDNMSEAVIPKLQKGWLMKQRRGGVVKNWKERFFVLIEGDITYFEDALDGRPPFGAIEKGGMELTGVDLEDKSGLQFCVVGKEGEKKNLLLEAEDIDTKETWMAAIAEHISYMNR